MNLAYFGIVLVSRRGGLMNVSLGRQNHKIPKQVKDGLGKVMPFLENRRIGGVSLGQALGGLHGMMGRMG